jgi:hypothetical protein
MPPCRFQAYKDEADAADSEVVQGSQAGGRRGGEDEAKWAAFDSMVESWLGGSRQQRAEVASYGEQEEEEGGGAARVLCARCYSLRHYGWGRPCCS